MDTSKIIIGTVGGGRYTVTAPIVKEDYGLYLKIEGLELPQTYEVDFSNDEHNGTAVTMIGNADGVLIPSQFIKSGKDVFAFLYHVGVDFGRTVYKFRIPNKLRPDRTDETPTPEEQSVIDQAISALNDAVVQTAQDVIDADASASAASQSESNAHDSELAAQGYASDARGYAERAETAESHAQGYAQSASGSAESASESAQSASGYAQTASIKASEASASATSASESAGTASTKASEASGYATTASNKASEASGYASTASTKAQQASASATTASTKAGEASQSATDASNSASSASTNALKAEGYAVGKQNGTDVDSESTYYHNNAKYYSEQASSSAESASASAESIAESAEQIATNTANISALDTRLTADESDILKAFPTDTASGSIASFTDGADNIPLKSLIVNIEPVQDLSNGDPSPTNICPISGWTEVDVEQSGKNLFDIRQFAKEYPDKCVYDDTTGELTVTSYGALYNQGVTVDIPLDVSDGGYLQFEAKNVSGANFRIKIVYKDGSIVETSGTGTATEYVKIARAIPAKRLVAVRVNWSSSGEFKIKNFCMSPTQTATPYEPYTGRSITIPLGQTVYGGRLDVLSGVMTVDRAMVDMGTLNWSDYSLASNCFKAILSDGKVTRTNYSADGICSSYAKANYITTLRDTDKTFGIGYTHLSANVCHLAVHDSSYSDAATFKTAMSGVQLCYELAEPITIQLTPQQVNSLLGVNNIFADTGDVSCEYRADVKLYIEKLTEPDADMVADSNIVSGQYFMVGNSLFKATANIASGSAVIVGTNATRLSLAQALNEINA